MSTITDGTAIYGIRQRRTVDGLSTGVWQLIRINPDAENDRGYDVLQTDANYEKLRSKLEYYNHR